jgi:hypothetical protein
LQNEESTINEAGECEPIRFYIFLVERDVAAEHLDDVVIRRNLNTTLDRLAYGAQVGAVDYYETYLGLDDLDGELETCSCGISRYEAGKHACTCPMDGYPVDVVARDSRVLNPGSLLAARIKFGDEVFSDCERMEREAQKARAQEAAPAE